MSQLSPKFRPHCALAYDTLRRKYSTHLRYLCLRLLALLGRLEIQANNRNIGFV